MRKSKGLEGGSIVEETAMKNTNEHTGTHRDGGGGGKESGIPELEPDPKAEELRREQQLAQCGFWLGREYEKPPAFFSSLVRELTNLAQLTLFSV